MSDVIRTFGMKEFNQAGSETERRVEEIRLLGYTIIADVLTDSEVELARRHLDYIYRVQAGEIGGEEQLKRFNDSYTARALLAYDDFFLNVATNRKVLPIVEALLGDYYTLMLQNGIINAPDVGTRQNSGSWHRDLNYQHFVSSRPLSISAIFCVDDFSQETGGTYVLPASHKTEAFPSEELVLRHEQIINASAGSVLVLDSMLFHRGGNNRSQNWRRALNHMYTLPFIKQQISFPKMLRGKYSDDPFLRRFLGYESEAGENVKQWREQRLERITAG